MDGPCCMLLIILDSFGGGEEDFEIEVALLPMSVPHRRLFASKDFGEHRIFLILQLAEEDYTKVGKGFGLIGDSLTRESMPNKAEYLERIYRSVHSQP